MKRCFYEKKYLTRMLTVLTVVGLSISGCTTGQENTAQAATLETQLTAVTDAVNAEKKYTDRDLAGTYDEATATKIVCSKTTATVEGKGAVVSNGTITISKAGVYVLSGTLQNGQVIVDAQKTDKVQIVLKGVQITCENNAPIYVKQSDKVFLTLAEGTTNTVTDGKDYALGAEETEPNAAIFSKSDLTINGTGELTVTANHNHGIFSKDDLVVASGTITVTALGDGLKGKDSVAIKDGTIAITAGGDGIQSSNATDTTKGWIAIDGGTFTINAEKDGVQAETELVIGAGVLGITTGEGSANVNVEAQPMGGKGGMGQRPEGMGEPPTPGEAPPEGMTKGERPTPPEGMETGQGTDTATSATPKGGDTATQPSTEGAVTDTAQTNTESQKALKAGTLIQITGGTFTIDAQDDALHSNGNVFIGDGTFTIATGDDAIHGDDMVVLEQGNIDITKSYEGVEGNTIAIKGGTLSVVAGDDGINGAGGMDASGFGGGMKDDAFGKTANTPTDATATNTTNTATTNTAATDTTATDTTATDTTTKETTTATTPSVTISGGTITVDAGGDGIDVNGNLFVSGGTVFVNGPTDSGNAALDYDGTAQITGGTVVAVGGNGMAQTFSDTSSQGSLMVSYQESQSAGTLVTLVDSNNKVLAAMTPTKAYQNVVIGAAGLEKGKTVTLYSCGTVSGTTLTGGTKIVTTTLSGAVTKISSDGTAITGGMQGGMRGGGQRKQPTQTAQ